MLKSKKSIFLVLILIFLVYNFRGIIKNLIELTSSLAISTEIIIAPKYNNTYKTPLIFESFSYEYWYSHAPFERAISMSEHSKFMDLLEIAGKIFGQNRMEYFLNLGTLIGIFLSYYKKDIFNFLYQLLIHRTKKCNCHKICISQLA